MLVAIAIYFLTVSQERSIWVAPLALAFRGLHSLRARHRGNGGSLCPQDLGSFILKHYDGFSSCPSCLLRALREPFGFLFWLRLCRAVLSVVNLHLLLGRMNHNPSVGLPAYASGP